MVSFKRELKTSPLLLCYFTCWVTGSDSNKEDFSEGGIFNMIRKACEAYTVSSEGLFFILPLLRLTVTFYCLIFLSWEVPTLSRLGSHSLDSTLILREKSPSLPFSGAFFRFLLSVLPRSWNPGTTWQSYTKGTRNGVGLILRKAGAASGEDLLPQLLRMLTKKAALLRVTRPFRNSSHSQ